jgi:hypothetical protein
MRRTSDTATFDLFDIPCAPAPVGGSLDYATELRCVLSDALKKTPRSRHEVAARMSELTGQDISKSMLDAWTAESKTPWRFPYEFAAAFEVACESTCLQELLGRKRGSRILVGEETLLTELGRIEKTKGELADRERALKERIRGKR